MTDRAMPRSVIYFERSAYLAIALTAVSIPLNWPTIAKYFDRYPIGYPIIIITVFGIQIFWVWLIARKRKNWARWITLAVVVSSSISSIFDIRERFDAGTAPALVYYVIGLVWLCSISFLFRPDARSWFRNARPETGL